MSENEEDRNKLAELRTLLALERNFLAEERTQLARLRTGLAFALIVPSLYLFITSININIPLFLVIISYAVLGFFFVRGIWTVYNAKSKLKKLRKQKEILNKKQKEIINSSESIRNTFEIIIEFNNNNSRFNIINKLKKAKK